MLFKKRVNGAFNLLSLQSVFKKSTAGTRMAVVISERYTHIDACFNILNCGEQKLDCVHVLLIFQSIRSVESLDVIPSTILLRITTVF